MKRGECYRGQNASVVAACAEERSSPANVQNEKCRLYEKINGIAAPERLRLRRSAATAVASGAMGHRALP